MRDMRDGWNDWKRHSNVHKGSDELRGLNRSDHDDNCHGHHVKHREETGSGNLTPTFTVLPGISTNDPGGMYLIPPDNAVAVSPDAILQTVNATVKWTDLAGNDVAEQGMGTFFETVPNYGYFLDTRALYDTATGRFIVSAGTEGAANGIANGNAYVLVAVSNDANPNNGWRFYSYQFTPTADVSNVSSVDQPSIAAEGSTLFTAASVGDRQLELVIAGDGAGPVKQIDLGANETAGVYKQVACDGMGDYALAQDYGILTLKHIEVDGSVDATSSVMLGTMGTPTSTLSATNGEQYLPTAGTTVPIDAGDTRIYGMSSPVGGVMYAMFEATPTSGADAGTPNVHWVELNVSDPSEIAVIDQGTISGSAIGVGVGTLDGSVAMDGAGDTIMNFVASGPNLTPTDYFEIKPPDDAPFSAPTVWDFSAGTYVQPNAAEFGSQVASRWGDYSSAIADPNNAHAFYASNEIGTTPGSWGWEAPIAHVTIPIAMS